MESKEINLTKKGKKKLTSQIFSDLIVSLAFYDVEYNTNNLV